MLAVSVGQPQPTDFLLLYNIQSALNGIDPKKLRYVPHYARKNGDKQKTKYLGDFKQGLAVVVKLS